MKTQTQTHLLEGHWINDTDARHSIHFGPNGSWYSTRAGLLHKGSWSSSDKHLTIKIDDPEKETINYKFRLDPPNLTLLDDRGQTHSFTFWRDAG